MYASEQPNITTVLSRSGRCRRNRVAQFFRIERISRSLNALVTRAPDVRYTSSSQRHDRLHLSKEANAKSFSFDVNLESKSSEEPRQSREFINLASLGRIPANAMSSKRFEASIAVWVAPFEKPRTRNRGLELPKCPGLLIRRQGSFSRTRESPSKHHLQSIGPCEIAGRDIEIVFLCEMDGSVSRMWSNEMVPGIEGSRCPK